MTLPYATKPENIPPVAPDGSLGKSGTVPNLALILAIVPALWWIALFFMSFSPNPVDGGVMEALGTLIFDAGVPMFGVWIAALIVTHIGFASRRSYSTPNRNKLIIALVLCYAQLGLIICAFAFLFVGLFFITSLFGVG